MRAPHWLGAWLVPALMLAACAGAAAAAPSAESVEINRIRRERQAAEVLYAQRAEACRQVFAVTDCLNKARGERRAMLDRLRQAEIVIDDERRRAKAAARMEAVERKTRAAAERAANASSAVEGEGKAARSPAKTRAPRAPASGAS